MGKTSKYIWPRDVNDAALWYLNILHDIGRGATLDEIVSRAIEYDPRKARANLRREIQRRLYKLIDRGLIHKQGEQSHAQFQLSKNGLSRLQSLSMRNAVHNTKKWDQIWRLIIFDIPEVKKESRFHIRRLLQELGFEKLQLSAWIHPLDFLDEFKQIQSAYGIADHLLLLNIQNFQPPARIITSFQKKYPTLNLSPNTHDRD